MLQARKSWQQEAQFNYGWIIVAKNVFLKSGAAVYLLAAQGWPFYRHRWGGCVKIRKEHRHSTTKCNVKYELAETEQRGMLVAHEDYSSYANCRTKIPVIFRGIFATAWGISKLLYIQPTVSRGHPNDVPGNPEWRTLSERKRNLEGKGNPLQVVFPPPPFLTFVNADSTATFQRFENTNSIFPAYFNRRVYSL